MSGQSPTITSPSFLANTTSPPTMPSPTSTRNGTGPNSGIEDLRIIRYPVSSSMGMLTLADNRSQSTDHGLQAVHSPRPTYLDFKPCFTRLRLTRRVIKLDFLFFYVIYLIISMFIFIYNNTFIFHFISSYKY